MGLSGGRVAGTVAALVAVGLINFGAPTSAGTAEPICDGKVATDGSTTSNQGQTVTGTDGDDVIIVGPEVLEVYGLAGDDTICHVAAYDDFANARLYGGAGDDRLFGDEGHHVLAGGKGADYLFGGYANDTFDGGPGDDVLDGSCDGCTFEGRYNDVADYTAPGYGDVDLDLLAGTAVARNGTDTLIDIADVVSGAGDDVLRGDAQGNRFWSEGGSDRLVGRAGDDHLRAGAGRDRADGGAGTDHCRAEHRVRCEHRSTHRCRPAPGRLGRLCPPGAVAQSVRAEDS
ncbi:hypothetical protein GCM10009844_43370 [Nocardioides koreensis]|uniref:Calcium-binding protein n=2 Tax=Nocardioides koreensis TaxID=433651 RepID=A0ABP5M0P1_9ACTN